MGDSLQGVWDRYHLGEAVVALGDGVVLAAVLVGTSMVALRTGRPALRRAATALDARWLALVGVQGAVLSGVFAAPSPARFVPWLVAAVVVVLPGDDPARPHPLGRWTAPLTVVSLAGIWSAVPDTEPPLMVAMVLVPTAWWWARAERSPGAAGWLALVVAGTGAAWVGSAGWGSALATVCALGAVAVAPLVLGVGRLPGTGVLTGRALAAVAASHVVVALVVPRSIMRREVPVAVGVAVVALLAVGLVAHLVRPNRPTHPNRARSSAS